MVAYAVIRPDQHATRRDNAASGRTVLDPSPCSFSDTSCARLLRPLVYREKQRRRKLRTGCTSPLFTEALQTSCIPTTTLQTTLDGLYPTHAVPWMRASTSVSCHGGERTAASEAPWNTDLSRTTRCPCAEKRAVQGSVRTPQHQLVCPISRVNLQPATHVTALKAFGRSWARALNTTSAAS